MGKRATIPIQKDFILPVRYKSPSQIISLSDLYRNPSKTSASLERKPLRSGALKKHIIPMQIAPMSIYLLA